MTHLTEDLSIDPYGRNKRVLLTGFLLVLLLSIGYHCFSSLFTTHPLAPAPSHSFLSGSPTSASPPKIIGKLMQFPLFFEKNEGQIDRTVRYLTRGPGYAFYFTPKNIGIVLQKTFQKNLIIASSILTLQFVEANEDPLIHGIEKQEYITNYFIGNDPNKWKTHLSNFAKVHYEGLYPGIDAIFYGNNQQIEYDICVAPGADSKQARLRITGAKQLSIDLTGDLCILMDDEQEIRMQKPIIYQMIEGKKTFIEGNLILLAHNEVGFTIGAYDKNEGLIIDPVLTFSSFLGGSGNDQGADVAVDLSENVYITGNTTSGNFPTLNPFQSSLSDTIDAFVTKVSPTGTLLYSTYLGGTDGITFGNNIVIDSSNNAYITGSTAATDFPTLNAFQSAHAGAVGVNDAFVTKLDATGSTLIYSTYLGGSSDDQGNAITLDSSDNAYIAGVTSSLDFPTLNAFQSTYAGGTSDGFVAKLDSSGSTLIYSTYLGGNGSDSARGIQVDSLGNAYVSGQTASTNFPTLNAFQLTRLGTVGDAFATKLDPTGSGLVYSTYLGGTGISSNTFSTSIALDNTGHAYLTGQTNSPNFPTTANAFQPARAGILPNVFITKFSPTGSSLVYSTYLGGAGGTNRGDEIVIDSGENMYVVGATNSASFPTTANAFQTAFSGGGNDCFITKMNSAGSALLFSSYFGQTMMDQGFGIAVGNENVYITGSTSSTTFPILNAFQPTYGGGAQDAFVANFGIATPMITSLNPSQGPVAGGTMVTITGINLSNATQVNFGGNPAMIISNTSTQIVVISPPGIGVVDVTVTTEFGTSPLSPADLFTYVEQVATNTTLTASPNPSIVDQSVELVATVTPSIVTGTVTFFDGTTILGTVSVSNGIASLTISSFTVGEHMLTAMYSGDDLFLPSTSPVITLVVNAIVIPVFPPTNLRGIQRDNQFATQEDIVNILTWQAPTQGNAPIAYRIYRNPKQTQLIAVISNQEKLRFSDHNRKKGKTYRYWIVSVDAFGNVSEPAIVTVKGH